MGYLVFTIYLGCLLSLIYAAKYDALEEMKVIRVIEGPEDQDQTHTSLEDCWQKYAYLMHRPLNGLCPIKHEYPRYAELKKVQEKLCLAGRQLWFNTKFVKPRYETWINPKILYKIEDQHSWNKARFAFKDLYHMSWLPIIRSLTQTSHLNSIKILFLYFVVDKDP